jgi:hypothetical protein
MTFYFTGVPVAYATVKTLTQESVRNCDGDLVAYKPSIIVGVPAIYEIIRKGMVKKIHESPSVVQSVFNLAYSLKRNVPMMGPALDKIVFAKVGMVTWSPRYTASFNHVNLYSPGQGRHWRKVEVDDEWRSRYEQSNPGVLEHHSGHCAAGIRLVQLMSSRMIAGPHRIRRPYP